MSTRVPPNQVTAPNAGGRRRFAVQTSLAARVGESRRWVNANFMRVMLPLLRVGASLVFLAGCVSNQTRGRSEVCEVHRTRMSKVTLPIEFGLFHPLERERARDAASVNEFPHALTWYNGGCVQSLT